MKHAGSQFLFSYWDDLRGERTAPDRRDLNIASLQPVLADTLLLEVDIDRRFPVRFAGEHVSAMFLHELAGQSFIDHWAAEDRLIVHRAFDTVMDAAVPVVAGVSAAPADRDLLPFELLLLPLRNFGKTHSRILAALTPSTTPPWLGLIPVETLQLTTLRVLEPREISIKRLSSVSWA